MVKTLGRMEEEAASTDGAVSKGIKVLGRMGEAVVSGASSAGESISAGLNEAEDFVEDVGQREGLSNRPGFRPQSLQEAGSNLSELTTKAGGVVADAVTPSPETTARALRFAAPVVSEILPINAAKFAEFLSNDGKISMTTEDLGSDADFLREAAIRTIQGGGNKFTYETWGFEDKSILMSDLATTSAKSFTDPNYRMATLIGRTGDGNVRVEDGRIVVEDVYDFNSGPRGRKLQQALVLKETGDMAGYEKLAEEALADLPYFGQMRVWGAALGVSQGDGTRFKLDLGPAPEDMEGEK